MESSPGSDHTKQESNDELRPLNTESLNRSYQKCSFHIPYAALRKLNNTKYHTAHEEATMADDSKNKSNPSGADDDKDVEERRRNIQVLSQAAVECTQNRPNASTKVSE